MKKTLLSDFFESNLKPKKRNIKEKRKKEISTEKENVFET